MHPRVGKAMPPECYVDEGTDTKWLNFFIVDLRIDTFCRIEQWNQMMDYEREKNYSVFLLSIMGKW